MRQLWLPLATAAVAACAFQSGCGGGGGGGGTGSGGTVRVTGRVLSVVTGGALNPVAFVQVGPNSVATNPADGSFTLSAPSGGREMQVDTQSGFGVFSFALPVLTEGLDLGDLYVGPERIRVEGTVRNATTGEPVGEAAITFAGRSATSDSNGFFRLVDVAYASSNPSGFWSIVGAATADTFFLASFNASNLTPTAGTITIDDILMVPSDDTDPPTLPYNLHGRVSPSAQAPGTIVTLRAGSLAVRVTTVGGDGRYFFWVAPGTYSITFAQGSLSAFVPSVTVTSTDQIIERNVTLQ